MKITGCRIVTPSGEIERGTLLIEKGIIKDVYPWIEDGERLDGMIVVPSFVDLHTHGISGYDFMKEDVEGQLQGMSKEYMKHGVTHFLPTTVSSPLTHMIRVLRDFVEVEGSVPVGVHFEGPYINKAMKGAQNPSYIRDANSREIKEIISMNFKKFLTITLAPEVGNNFEVIPELVEKGIRVSLGHTNADFDTAVKAINAGADRITHLFNAMRPFHHRDPGIILAALQSDILTEVIADGIHVNPEVIRFVVKVKGSSKVVVVTDSISATDLKDGEYELGGLKVNVKGGIAKTEDGKLAGSTITMEKEFSNLIRWGIPLKDAVLMTSTNASRYMGLNTGEISKGKEANLVVLDEKMNLKRVYLKGEIIYEN
ncbi:N-acetylglucosamine-6-phosphate deacetylase [Acidianus sp. RZ1]|uniref:N-acetylglucosamine-6-phosphate deacetylase n=1 Tax=Acidianus sp. RZ1 TaxID=1540082 RepID=UPI001492F80E|nr:N-acetylglucosamine-6-phosphate deacetylase [Acidianus sp. RZ1]NON61213.1 N-acetylglucosamine-6-phosphate deacetylase [Acidianus sp. RZ1]